MVAFAAHIQCFYPKTGKQSTVPVHDTINKAVFIISGMICSVCDDDMNDELNKLPANTKTAVSYKAGKAKVEFDQHQYGIRELKPFSQTAGSVNDKKGLK
jgi:copper chaperone CopZ